jgi:hypothetical protein
MTNFPAGALSRFRQPREALEPSGFAIEAAERWALERAAHISVERVRLTSFWYIDYVRQQSPGERKTRYIMRLAQSHDYGVACGLSVPIPGSDFDLVGEDSRAIIKGCRYRDDIDRAALVDLILGHVSSAPSCEVSLSGTLPEKYAFRSRLFADEAEDVLQRKGSGVRKWSHPRIHVIGATAGMIGGLIARGFEVSATDMEPGVVGQELGGVKVRGNTANSELIKEADLAIITGMTLPNRTLPGIMEMAREHQTSTMIWAITGRNFGHYYLEQGVDCVISDPSPFLLLPGPARISIWRREH